MTGVISERQLYGKHPDRKYFLKCRLEKELQLMQTAKSAENAVVKKLIFQWIANRIA